MPDSKPTSTRLIFGLVAAALIAAAVFVLRDGAGPDATPPPGNVLHRGLGTDPETFDAQQSQSVQASIVQRDLGEGLMTYTAGGKLVPGAAEDWSVSDDGLVYTFVLREDGRWSNCDPVTADDFVYAFRRLVDPATAAPRTQSLGIVVNASQIIAGQLPPTDLGVRAVDPRTLEVTLEQPTPYFLHLLTRPSAFPQHAQNIATHGAQHARPGTLISNGAYTLAAVTPGALVELERNACYHDAGSTAIERVHYHVHVEPMSEYNRFRAGELHITSTLPASNFASIREQFPDELRIAPSLGVYYYGFNVSRPPFADNPLLREALSMAIDREVLVDKITARGEKPAYSWVPPGLDGYTPPTMTFSKLAKADREERARALYQQAGFSAQNPARFELRYNTHEDHKQIALAVKSMWETVLGAEVELVNVEFKVLLSQMYAGTITQAFRSSWNGDYPDPHTFLSILESDNPQNLPRWNNDEYDSLMERASKQLDLDTRARYMEEAERLLLSEHAVVPLYFYVSKHLVSKNVVGWEDNILDYHYSQHFHLENR